MKMSYEEYNYKQSIILFGLLGSCKGIMSFDNLDFAQEVLRETVQQVEKQLVNLEYEYLMAKTSPDDKVIK